MQRMKGEFMKYQYILFDLDGTITESAPGIVNSVRYALNKMKYEVRDEKELLRFIGPPLIDSMKKFYGMNDEQAEQAVIFYREYFSEKGLFENSVYDGIEECMQQLKEKGKILAIATSKPEEYSVRIAEHFGFANRFDKICGATMDKSRTEKADVIRYTLKTLGITDENKSSVLMVGDRRHDIIGAKENGLDSMGVLYGYGDRDELEEAGAVYIAESTKDISEIIMKSEEE